MSDIQRKAFAGTCEIKDEAKGEIEAVIATLNVVDKDGDVILPTAVKDGQKAKMSSYAHSAVGGFFGGGEMPVGSGTVHPVRDKLVFRGRVYKTPRGQEAFTVLKEEGRDQEWSFGYQIIGREVPGDEWKGTGAERILTKLIVFEVSPVLMGAGIDTHTVSAKGAAAPAVHEQVRRFERLRAAAAALDEPWTPDREATLRDHLARFRVAEGLMPGVQVHPAKAALAGEVVAWAAERWGITAPAVKFVSAANMPAGWGGFQGGGDPARVHLRSDLDGWDLVATSIHECSHVARYLKGLVNSEPEVELDTSALLRAYQEEAFNGRQH